MEAKTLKEYLNSLQTQADVDSIMAKDANGNPVWIKKADLAQVAAELIGTATAEKDGLLNARDFNEHFQFKRLSNNLKYKIAVNYTNYSSLAIIGVSTIRYKPIHIVVCALPNKDVFYGGDKADLDLKVDSEKNIYVGGRSATDFKLSFIGDLIPFTRVTEYPEDAVDVPQYAG